MVVVAKHPTGKEIRFNEEDHSYIDDEGVTYVSVTTVIKGGFPPFDTEKVSKRYAKKHGLDQEEVKRKWAQVGQEARDMGTKVHAFAEAIFKGESKPEATNEKEEVRFAAVEKFIEGTLSDYEILDVEKIIFSPDHRLAGTVDLLVRDKAGEIGLLDWKICKEIKMANAFAKGLHCVSHLDDCNYNHYSLQLNLYRRILKMNGYFDPDTHYMMRLLLVGEEGVEPIFVSDLDEEAEELLDYVKRLAE